MEQKIIITKIDGKIITAVQEDGVIEEIHCHHNETKKSFALGNIYIGKVKKIVNNIQAAFVEIAPNVECYFDLRKNNNIIFTHKIGSASLCAGDEIIVQIQKEAQKTKEITVTSNLNLTGSYVVLIHGENTIGVSGKISKEQRVFLKERFQTFVSEEFGLVLRTNAQTVEPEVIETEIHELTAVYNQLLQTGDKRVCFSCLRANKKEYLLDIQHGRQDILSLILVEDTKLYHEIKEFLQEEQPIMLPKLQHYQDKMLPLHKLYSIESIIKQVLQERVWLKSGAYLIIQPTEAMIVIDVNTGKAISKKKNTDFFHKINLEAAVEIAKQIRLRNLSGIIIIDFINVRETGSCKELLYTLQRELKKDPIQTTFVDITKLQLVEITRKKIKKPFHESYQI